MKQRKLVIGLLVMLAVAVSGFTFAYWNDGVTGSNATVEDTTIGIGSGGTATTKVVFGVTSASNTLDLVPTDYQDGTTTTNTVTLTFLVDWQEDGVVDGATGAVSTLAVTVSNAVIRNFADTTDTPIGSMFTIVPVTGQAITAGTQLPVDVVITFTTEPASEAIYDLIADGNLVFDLSFTVSDVA